MSSIGRVIGGAYLNSTVTTATFGHDLVVQAGFKGRKLTAETVVSWTEMPVEARDGAFSAMGKAAAGVALPGRLGKAASAAVGAAFDSKKPVHHVRVEWADGKQSLIKLPAALFTHLEIVLADRLVATPESERMTEAAAVETIPTIADKTFDLVSGLVMDRFPSKSQAPAETSEMVTAQFDVTDQLQKLASLRDAGILTEDEFSTKKAELLARM